MPPKDKEEYNAYMKNYMLIRYKKRMEQYIEYLGGKCIKSFTIGKNWNLSKEKMLVELVKCQLLCEDCHIEKSKLNKDFSHPYISNQYTKEKYLERHGRLAGWTDGCRCNLCKEFKSKYRKGLLDSRGNIKGS